MLFAVLRSGGDPFWFREVLDIVHMVNRSRLARMAADYALQIYIRPGSACSYHHTLLRPYLAETSSAMPVAVATSLPQYRRIPSTKEDRTTFFLQMPWSVTDSYLVYRHTVEYAGLPVIDLSKADSYEGRVELAKGVTEAMTTIGFFYIINHGLTQAQVDARCPHLVEFTNICSE